MTATAVMTGLVPVIHAATFLPGLGPFRRPDDVDGRDKPGHDGEGLLIQRTAA